MTVSPSYSYHPLPSPNTSYLPSDKDVEADPIELEQTPSLHT